MVQPTSENIPTVEVGRPPLLLNHFTTHRDVLKSQKLLKIGHFKVNIYEPQVSLQITNHCVKYIFFSIVLTLRTKSSVPECITWSNQVIQILREKNKE